MYTGITSTFHATGKAREAIAVLQDWLAIRQDRGIPGSLSMLVSGGEPRINTALRYPNLAAMESDVRETRAQPAYEQFLAKMGSLTRAPARTRINQVIALPADGPPPAYLSVVTAYPILGKIAEMRCCLADYQQASTAKAPRWGFARPIASAEGPVFVSTLLYSSLGEIETVGQQMAADADFQQFNATLLALARQPPMGELFEVIVPFPN